MEIYEVKWHIFEGTFFYNDQKPSDVETFLHNKNLGYPYNIVNVIENEVIIPEEDTSKEIISNKLKANSAEMIARVTQLYGTKMPVPNRFGMEIVETESQDFFEFHEWLLSNEIYFENASTGSGMNYADYDQLYSNNRLYSTAFLPKCKDNIYIPETNLIDNLKEYPEYSIVCSVKKSKDKYRIRGVILSKGDIDEIFS